MASGLNAGNVRVAVTGIVWTGNTSATAPSQIAASPAGFSNLGYCDDSGVTLTMPGEGDKTTIRAWQNGDPVRTLRTPSEDVPELSLNFLEMTTAVVQATFGVTVSKTASHGTWNYKVGNRAPKSWILDVVDGSDLIRIYIPKGTVTEISDIEFVSTDAIKFGITIGCDLDSATDYNFKAWASALKTSGV